MAVIRELKPKREPIREIAPKTARKLMKNAWDKVSKTFKVSRGIQSYHKRGGKAAADIALEQLTRDLTAGKYLPAGFIDRCERKRLRIKKAKHRDAVFARTKPILTTEELGTLHRSLKTCHSAGKGLAEKYETDALNNALVTISAYTFLEDEHNNLLRDLEEADE